MAWDPTKSRAPKGTGTIYLTTHNGVEKWCAAMTMPREPGQPRRVVRGYGATKTEAIKNRQRLYEKRLSEPQKKKKHPNTPLLSEALRAWLEARKGYISEVSQRKYRVDIERHVITHVGDVHLAELTESRLRRLFNEDLSEAGPSARKHVHTNLNSMLNWHLQRKIIEENPLRFVSKPKASSTVRDDDNKWINRRISVVQNMLVWLADPANKYHDEHYVRTLFMLLGLRRAELLGLEWSCVSSLTKKGHATLLVKQQLHRYEKHELPKKGWYIYPYTKNEKSRSIFLPETFRKALVTHKSATKHLPRDGEWFDNMIFRRPNGSAPNYKYFEESWRMLLTDYWNKDRADKVPLTDEEYFRPHAVRHIAASLLFAQGITLQDAQDILGHSEAATSLYYRHVTKESRERSTLALEAGLTDKLDSPDF